MQDTPSGRSEAETRNAPLPETDVHYDAERILVRFSGDITTKAPPTRRRFLTRMSRNLKDALRSKSIRHRMTRTHSRIYIDIEEGRVTQALDCLSRVFGVQSLSRVLDREWHTLDDLVAAGNEIFSEAVRDRSFAVRARRVGDRNRIPIRSEQLQRELGTALLRSAREVSLNEPEVTAAVEVAPGHAHFFSDRVVAEGGLPLACEGRAVALVSGGFDSPVAAWLLKKRGVELDYVFCNLGGRNHQLETMQVMKVISDLWSYGTRPHLHAFEIEYVTRYLQAGVTTRYWQVVLKRLMMRAAEAVATERDASAIITGEAVGQVSSQTLPNLSVISAATSMPIFRPLIGFNKEEIIALSRKIGTHDLSASVGEYCALVPSKPATQTTLARIEAEEESLDPDILARAIAERSVFDLRSLDLSSLERPDIQTESVGKDEIVLDLRSKAAYENWHYPGALFLDFQSAVRAYPHMEKQASYVLYCEFGLKSGHLAEQMRRAGLRASHFAGGAKALIQYAAQSGLATPQG
ncbi:MAG: tRNA uracil 4-sulfurtransferase ThiI [Myxococcota bacterium]|nr:tRNA uracil 4-sulfurtransferase ThiI [Myxococcota bacterium]